MVPPMSSLSSPSSSSLLIDPPRLAALLGERRNRVDILCSEECASTNTELLRRASAGAPSGSVLVTDRQTAGRGSRGRTWFASPEASLTFSVLWEFPGEVARTSGLSLAVGVAIVRALTGCGATGVMLKWPNDILVDEAKLGGILIELLADDEGVRAVIGIGLNLRLPESIGPPNAAALPPAALEDIVPIPVDRHVVLAALLSELVTVLDRFSREGFAGLQKSWHGCHAWQGRPVRLLREGRVEAEGVCVGADVDGALLVRTINGVERFLSGDVSLRPK